MQPLIVLGLITPGVVLGRPGIEVLYDQNRNLPDFKTSAIYPLRQSIVSVGSSC